MRRLKPGRKVGGLPRRLTRCVPAGQPSHPLVAASRLWRGQAAPLPCSATVKVTRWPPADASRPEGVIVAATLTEPQPQPA